jgi:hypothetical protein
MTQKWPLVSVWPTRQAPEIGSTMCGHDIGVAIQQSTVLCIDRKQFLRLCFGSIFSSIAGEGFLYA